MADTTGARIKRQRHALGLSVDEVAAALGKGPATIYRYERYDYDQIPAEVIDALAKHLQVSVDYLLRLTDDLTATGGDLNKIKLTQTATTISALQDSPFFIGTPGELSACAAQQTSKRLKFNKRFQRYFNQLTDEEIETVLDFMGYLASKHKD